METVVFLLDKSGSMSHRTKDTIKGFNCFVDDLKEKHPSSKLSLFMFNESCDCVYKDVPVDQVVELKECDYNPVGGTALFDSMGLILTNYEKGKFIILTDGYENESEQYTQKAIKKMITKSALDITYIGADVTQSADMGIRKSEYYNGRDTLSAFRSASQSI
jgi:uncharacterized protein with von Willebrand factor type A (vWA) domain